MYSKRKVLAPIAIIAVILVVVIGAYFALVKQTLIVDYPAHPIGQTPPAPVEPFPQPAHQDETANWKIYRNEKYSFEFKYPFQDDLKVNSELITGINCYSLEIFRKDEQRSWFGISINCPGRGLEGNTAQPDVIDGKNANRYIWKNVNNEDILIVLFRGDNVYNFFGNQLSEGERLFNQILSTFTFTK